MDYYCDMEAGTNMNVEYMMIFMALVVAIGMVSVIAYFIRNSS